MCSMYVSDGISGNIKLVRDLAFTYLSFVQKKKKKTKDGKVTRERNEIPADAGLPIKNYSADPR